MKSRLKTAIAFLRDNESFTVGDLRLGVTDTGDIQVTGWSQYTDYRNLSKAKCLDELTEVKKIFYNMLVSSEDLKTFVSGKAIEYYLDFDDYGKVSIGICSEKNGHVNWYIDLK